MAALCQIIALGHGVGGGHQRRFVIVIVRLSEYMVCCVNVSLEHGAHHPAVWRYLALVRRLGAHVEEIRCCSWGLAVNVLCCVGCSLRACGQALCYGEDKVWLLSVGGVSDAFLMSEKCTTTVAKGC